VNSACCDQNRLKQFIEGAAVNADDSFTASQYLDRDLSHVCHKIRGIRIAAGLRNRLNLCRFVELKVNEPIAVAEQI